MPVDGQAPGAWSFFAMNLLNYETTFTAAATQATTGASRSPGGRAAPAARGLRHGGPAGPPPPALCSDRCHATPYPTPTPSQLM